MRALRFLLSGSIPLFLLFFFITQQNETIEITSTEIVSDESKNERLINTPEKTYKVPNGDRLNMDWAESWVLLNLDADEDWEALQQPGTYYVRTYGLHFPALGMRKKIITILDDPNEPHFVVKLGTVIVAEINSNIK
jgi:hypothetical protein